MAGKAGTIAQNLLQHLHLILGKGRLQIGKMHELGIRLNRLTQPIGEALGKLVKTKFRECRGTAKSQHCFQHPKR
jgi:hypothetical protein